MKALILIAAQHAGVADIFTQLVPKWALAALFSRIMGTDDSDQLMLSSTQLQGWMLAEKVSVPSKLILDLFMGASSTDAASKGDFVRVRLLLQPIANCQVV
jgi:hypothetical protein